MHTRDLLLLFLGAALLVLFLQNLRSDAPGMRVQPGAHGTRIEYSESGGRRCG